MSYTIQKIYSTTANQSTEMIDSLYSLLGEYSSLSLSPQIRSSEVDGAYLFELDLPGYKKEEIKVELENPQRLSIKAANKTKGSILKSFNLWDGLDTNEIEANLADGVLSVRIKKFEKPRAKKIEIK